MLMGLEGVDLLVLEGISVVSVEFVAGDNVHQVQSHGLNPPV